MKKPYSNHEQPTISKDYFRPCPNKPNCVNSEAKDSHFIEPLRFNEEPETVWKKVQEIILETGGEITKVDPHHLEAIYTSTLMHFKDDVEMRMVPELHCIHIRSASRVGYADFGVNRTRVEKIRELFTKQCL